MDDGAWDALAFREARLLLVDRDAARAHAPAGAARALCASSEDAARRVLFNGTLRAARAGWECVGVALGRRAVGGGAERSVCVHERLAFPFEALAGPCQGVLMPTGWLPNLIFAGWPIRAQCR